MGSQNSLIQKYIPFEMVVDTTIAGSSGVGNFIIPLINSGSYSYRFLINWGDGYENRITTWNDPSLTHTYTGGTSPYTIKIYGKCDYIGYNFAADSDKILDILSWGNIAWGTFGQSFSGGLNLSGVTTTPPIVERVNGNYLQTFAFSPKLDFDMGLWDTSNALYLQSTFRNCSIFNNGGSPSISGWSTTNCVSMSSLFEGSAFNQPIDSWDVSNVVNHMAYMFKDTPFNQVLSSWDVSQVTNMTAMFEGTPFNQDIGSWVVSSCGGLSSMFKNNTVFNNSGSTSISGWTTSACTNMSSMFYQSDAFNQPIDSWDVSKVTSMDSMFFGTALFNQPLNSWNVGNVITLEDMFWGSVFDQPLNNWNTSGVTNMSSTFDSADFNQDIGSWDVSGVDGTAFNNGFQGMFSSNPFFNNGGSPSISGWTIGSSPVSMRSMFQNADAFNQPIGPWDVSNVTDMSFMFAASALFNQNLSNWDVGNVTTFRSTFNGTPFNNGGSPDISGWTVSNLTTTQGMFSSSASFNQPIGSWDTSNILDMSFMFDGATLFNQPIDSWDVSNVTSTAAMFQNGDAFNQPLDSWDVSKVIDMSSMFDTNPSSFDQDISMWNVSGVTNMTKMLDNSNISVDNYNHILTGWTGWDGTGTTKTLVSGVTFGAAGLNFTSGSTAEDARNYLITGLTWTITDGGGV